MDLSFGFTVLLVLLGYSSQQLPGEPDQPGTGTSTEPHALVQYSTIGFTAKRDNQRAGKGDPNTDCSRADNHWHYSKLL